MNNPETAHLKALAALEALGDDASYTTPDATGIAPCCQDPRHRRTSTVDPAQLAAARGGTPGLQVCSVCGRRHYTFTVQPQAVPAPRGG